MKVQVIETRRKKLGAGHPDTLTSIGSLASTYRDQGRWDAAEELEVQAMEAFKKNLGANHPSTLISQTTATLKLGKGQESLRYFLFRFWDLRFILPVGSNEN